MIQLTLTLKMTAAQVVETWGTVNNNSPNQDYVHPDDQTQAFFVNGVLSTPGQFGTKGSADSRVILAILVLIRWVSTVINTGMNFWYFQQKDSETIQTQQLLEKIDDYETQIEDYKSELDKVNKVGDTLVYIIFHSLTCSWQKKIKWKNE